MHLLLAGTRVANILHKRLRRANLTNAHLFGQFRQRRLGAHPDNIIDGNIVTKHNFRSIVKVNYSIQAGAVNPKIIQEGAVLPER